MPSFKNMQLRNELAEYLGVPKKKLTHILYIQKIENCYHTFKIPKRTGGDPREISAPDADLKSIQKRLAYLLQKYRHEIWNEKKTNPNISHAFEKDKGIITNARIHRNKRYVVNLDLLDFFGSIHFGRVLGYFEQNENFKMSHEVATVMAQLCCYNKKLPQGAPTSPVISNMICEILDFKLLQIAKKYHLDYTRYADDLTFSTNDNTFLEKYESFFHSVNGAINHAGFTINEKKTRLQYRDSRQSVTGLVVNKKLSVDRRYYKNTRAMANRMYKTSEFLIDGNPGTLAQLEGRFAFINQLDKYDNENNQQKRNFKSLNGRETEYQKFLYYKYFIANDKPLIVTEGKTDILYLKAALMNLHERYPELIQMQADGSFNFKIRFFRRSKRLRYFLGIEINGADTMEKIYSFYSGKPIKGKEFFYYKYFSRLCPSHPKHPVVLLFDNELSQKEKPLHKFVKNLPKGHSAIVESQIKTSHSSKLMEESNLYLLTHQLVDGKLFCEIEELFDNKTRNVTLDGKKLSLNSDWDQKTEFGKDIFSKYIFDNYKSIDFSRFTVMLDGLNDIVVEYHKSVEEAK